MIKLEISIVRVTTAYEFFVIKHVHQSTLNKASRITQTYLENLKLFSLKHSVREMFKLRTRYKEGGYEGGKKRKTRSHSLSNNIKRGAESA